MTTPAADSELIKLLTRFRSEAEKQNATALRQLGSAYSKLYKRLSEKLELEARRIFEEGGDTISRAWIQNRLSDLFEQIADELRKYSAFVETTIDAGTDDALLLGGKQALELMRAATLGQKQAVGIQFDKLNTDQIETIVGFLSPDSPLRKRIGEMSGYYSSVIEEQLVEAIALGYNPYKTAGNIAPFLSKVQETAKNGFNSVLAAAVRLTRTAQLWTYREASRANYNMNSDVVTGWQWFAQINDPNTCMSCIAQHGTIHPLDEVLDDHHHGRCTPLPVVLGRPLISETAGTDYFNGLSEAEQRQRMGNGMFESWKSGAFGLEELSKQVENDVYGSMRVVPSLKDLLGVD